MSKVRIITDSASDIPKDLAEQYGVEVVPLTLRFGNDVFVERRDITTEEFYARMAMEEELPQTSAPSPGDFKVAFTRVAESGAESAVCITLSSHLSATAKSAEIAATDMAGEFKIHNIDSFSVTAGEFLLVLEAAKLAEAGKSGSEIVSAVEGHIKNLECFGLLNTLDNLKKGGRIGGARAVFGSLLSIKPILDLSSGEVVAAGKVRTRRKSFEWLRDKVAGISSPISMAIGHGGAEDFPELLEMLKEVVDLDSVYTGQIGPVVGTHAGAGVVGLAYILAE